MKRLLIALAIGNSLIGIVAAQTPSPTAIATQQPSPSGITSPNTSPTPDDHYLREGLKNMSDDARGNMGWALTLIGASVLAIVSTSYMRPLSRKFRYVYLLFLPGWILLSWSIYEGDKVCRRYTAATFAPNRKRLLEIGDLMNTNFDSQLTLFHWALLFFAIWLLVYLLWWVVTDVPVVKEK